jgi:putative hydrolase of the HAD superfamily
MSANPFEPAGLKQASAMAPDFRHVRHWIFDLDNTLYCAGSGVFAQIESRMTDFVAALTGLERTEARRLQKELYRQYGTTLKGLMATRGLDPEPYLSFVHDIDLGPLQPDAALAFAIARLPGRRYVFTNGCRHHAARILARLELAHLFDDIWDIRTIDFIPKPDRRAYELVVAAAAVEAGRAAMFDDIAPNLTPARALGMTTVWLKNAHDFSPQGGHQTGPAEIPLAAPCHIDHETADLIDFLNSIRI